MNNKYNVIYADPPWKFSTYSEKGKGRSAEAWYDCLSVEDICALPIENLAAKDCVLFMWVTDPFLFRAQDVIRAWSFEPKTVAFYWVKCIPVKVIGGLSNHPEWWPIGTGYWTRANPEQCLLATRGHPKRKNADVPKLIIAPRREHSRKPDEAYDRIERLCDGPYIELFSRQRRVGWDSIGDEVDIGPRRERKWKSNKGPEYAS